MSRAAAPPRRFILAAVVAAVGTFSLAGCREERPTIPLTPVQESALRAKADETIDAIVRRNPEGRFAAVVVFRSDVFLRHSAMLERRNISVLDGRDNVAVLLLAPEEVPPLLAEDAVRRAFYFCAPGRLVRLHPIFLMEILRRYGEGKEKEPIAFAARFREPPKPEARKAVEAAGFSIIDDAGAVLALSGPLESLPRLLDTDLVVYYEGATAGETV